MVTPLSDGPTGTYCNGESAEQYLKWPSVTQGNGNDGANLWSVRQKDPTGPAVILKLDPDAQGGASGSAEAWEYPSREAALADYIAIPGLA